MPFNITLGDYVFIPPVDPRTKSARTILGQAHVDDPGLLDAALEEFLSKNDDYDDASDALGIVGQVSDLWRKIVKLKKVIIDSGHLNGEDPRQLIRDIFGHSLLALYYDDILRAKVKETLVERDAEDVVNAVAPEPAYLHTLRDSVLAMKENGATWQSIQGFLKELEDSYGEPEPLAKDIGAKSPMQARALYRLKIAIREAMEVGASSDQMEAAVWDEFHSNTNPFEKA